MKPGQPAPTAGQPGTDGGGRKQAAEGTAGSTFGFERSGGFKLPLLQRGGDGGGRGTERWRRLGLRVTTPPASATVTPVCLLPQAIVFSEKVKLY